MNDVRKSHSEVLWKGFVLLIFLSWKHPALFEFKLMIVFMPPEIGDFCPVCHYVIFFILSLCKSVWNFNFANSFWSVRARALISYTQDLSVDSYNSDLVNLTLYFDLLFENLKLANNFWTLSARALISHTIQHLWVSVSTNNSDRVTLSLEFDLFKNTLTLLTSKQWVLLIFHECFLWHNLSVAINIFYPLTFNLVFFLKTFTMLIIFDLALALILHLNIPYDEIFSWYLSFWPWDDQFLKKWQWS